MFPAAALARARASEKDFPIAISAMTLYSYIDKGIFLKLTNKRLPEREKRRKHKNYKKVVRVKRAPRGTSIEKRPLEVNSRMTWGHWEISERREDYRRRIGQQTYSARSPSQFMSVFFISLILPIPPTLLIRRQLPVMVCEMHR
ncbi:hypothetical protein FACS1894217_08000 [Clostridia bacterium]|nr:hypothetical protein FACS1894217_08000 [Clostridia bacterium]